MRSFVVAVALNADDLMVCVTAGIVEVYTEERPILAFGFANVGYGERWDIRSALTYMILMYLAELSIHTPHMLIAKRDNEFCG